MYYHWAISSSISSTPNNPLVSILDEFCLSKLGSWVDDSSSSLAFFMCLDKVLLLWYAWNGSSLWEEWCLLAWRFIIEIFAGTIYPSLQFSLDTSGSLKSAMQLCISLTLIAKVFFYFLNSLTSHVKVTVYRFSLTIMVLRILSSIFLKLLVLTTCFIR